MDNPSPALQYYEKEISLKSFLVNFLLLYFFGGFGQLIPSYTGVYRRGFFCNDQSIMLPYKTETVSANQLFLYCILVNAVTVLIVEYLWERENILKPRRKYTWKGRDIHTLVVRFFKYFGYAQLGFVCVLTVTEVTKTILGRLRPHFLDVCRPENITCTDVNTYINDYTCTGDPVMVREARKSFISGHSSLAMYCSIWSAIYLYARIPTTYHHRVLIPLTQTLFVVCGLMISLSRINDHMHHWSDVLVGIIVGSIVAIYSCTHWADLNEKENLMKTVASDSSSSFTVIEENNRDREIQNEA